MAERLVIVWALALCAAALIPAGAESQVRAQAATVTSNATFPIATTEAACNGEAVTVTGNFHLLAHVTTDARTGRHVVLQMNTQGVKGTALPSTNVYVSNTTIHDSFNDPETTGGVSTHTYVAKFLLIGKGDVPDMLVRSNVHITVNNNGEVTAFTSNSSARCG